jgi:hypothetical protein
MPPWDPWDTEMRGGEGRVVIGKGVGQRGGQATIMMCGCDGGWNGGDGSLKSIFKWIWAVNHGF